MTTTGTPIPDGGNPAFDRPEVQQAFATPDTQSAMSVGGVTVKTLLFLIVLVLAGMFGWNATVDPASADAAGGYGSVTISVPPGFWLASFAAFGAGIYTAINPRAAMVSGLIYALLEGYILGSISAMFDAQTEGIVGAAILATVCVFFVSLVLYATRIVKPTAKMAFGVTAALGGLALLYFFVWILAIFDVSFLYSEEFRTVGLIITIIAVVLAALTLTLNFAAIEAGVNTGAPKWLEWYSAYGLMVTLIWLYLMLLRLLAILNRN